MNPHSRDRLLDDLLVGPHPAPPRPLAELIQREKRRRARVRTALASGALVSLAAAIFETIRPEPPAPAAAVVVVPVAPATPEFEITSLSDEELLQQLAALGRPAALAHGEDGSTRLILLPGDQLP